MIKRMSIDVVFTEESTASGDGRNGHVKSADGRIDFDALAENPAMPDGIGAERGLQLDLAFLQCLEEGNRGRQLAAFVPGAADDEQEGGNVFHGAGNGSAGFRFQIAARVKGGFPRGRVLGDDAISVARARGRGATTRTDQSADVPKNANVAAYRYGTAGGLRSIASS